MNVKLFAVNQTDNAESEEWFGSFGQYVDDNCLDIAETTEVVKALGDKGEYWTGGGAQQLMVLRLHVCDDGCRSNGCA